MKTRRQVLFTYLRVALLVLTAALYTHCGPNNGTGTSNNQPTACTPNVIDSGLQLSVTKMGGSTYKFMLCADGQYSNVTYTVYGAPTQGDVDKPGIDLKSRWREANITASNSAGNAYQVTFHESDNYFAVYLDDPNARDERNPQGLSSNVTLVSPHRLPDR